jgi:hypothetical protein
MTMPYPFRGLWFTMLVSLLIGFGLYVVGLEAWPWGYLLQLGITFAATMAYLLANRNWP